jgi:hypothetical protein
MINFFLPTSVRSLQIHEHSALFFRFLSELYLFKNRSILRPAKRTTPLKPFAKAGMPSIEIKASAVF